MKCNVQYTGLNVSAADRLGMSCSCYRRAALTVPVLLSHPETFPKHFVPCSLAVGFQCPICDADFQQEVSRFGFLAKYQRCCWEHFMWWSDFGVPSLAELPRYLSSWEGSCSIIKALSLLLSVQSTDLSFSVPAFSHFQLYSFSQASPVFKTSFYLYFSLKASHFVLFCPCPLLYSKHLFRMKVLLLTTWVNYWQCYGMVVAFTLSSIPLIKEN